MKPVKEAVAEISVELEPFGAEAGKGSAGGAAAPTQQVAQALQEPDAKAPADGAWPLAASTAAGKCCAW